MMRQFLLIFVLFCAEPLTSTARSLKASHSNQRDALVVAPIGDTSLHKTWLHDAHNRTWDLVALYYGDDPESFKCNECVGVQPSRGAKWRIISKFLNSTLWKKLAPKYNIIMIADDDLELPSDMLDSFFKLFKEYNLILGQPSVCPYDFLFITTITFPWTHIAQRALTPCIHCIHLQR